MEKKEEFSFGDDSVAKSYDKFLVPILFEPWANHLINENYHWAGKHVLDLATGTGVLASKLIDKVGPNGRITAIDMNIQMLEVAKKRCGNKLTNIDFIACSAESIQIDSEEIDIVACQQGFQFFPDKSAATLEIYRVLKNKGQIFISTWCPVSECHFFGAICEALELMGEYEISQMMRVPFDFLSQEELFYQFKSVGFTQIQVSKEQMDMYISGGIEGAVATAFATPIGGKLHAMTIERQNEFRKILTGILEEHSQDNINCGPMTTNILTAQK